MRTRKFFTVTCLAHNTFVCMNERTNEVYLPINRVHNDWLPVEAEAHQSWPPKNKKETDKLTNRERQKKTKKRKYIVIHKI